MRSKIKTAVIMAAGLGTRFGHYTKTLPKGFIKVGEIPMIIRSIDTLLLCGINRILIGTGYKEECYEQLKQKYPQIDTCYNPLYAETNSMYTLYNMMSLIGEDDFILLESDIVYERRAITSLLKYDKQDVMLISELMKFQDEYFIEANSNNILTNCSINKNELHHITGELVGIHKISNTFYKKMCQNYGFIKSEQPKLGYEYQLLHMSCAISPVYILKPDKLLWYEIDDERDLKYAEEHIVPYC